MKNILISGNDTYSFAIKVFLFSLLKNSKDDVTIYFLYNDLNENNMVAIRAEVNQFSYARIEFIFVPNYLFKDVPLKAVTNSYITIETYFRMAVGELLPKKVDRILYLDTDIIVNGNYEEFYNHKFERESVALVCEDYGFKIAKSLKAQVYRNLGLEKDYRYFNAGVILINMENFRKYFSLNMFLEYVNENREKLMFHDQDVLNAMFKNRLEYADYSIYNCRPFFYAISSKNEKKISENAVFIHYGEKPWNTDFSDMSGKIFWRYASEAGFDKEYNIFIEKNAKYRTAYKKRIFIKKIKRNIKLRLLRTIIGVR